MTAPTPGSGSPPVDAAMGGPPMDGPPMDGLSPEAQQGLARFVGRKPPPPPGTSCEICAEPLGDEHSHIADVTGRGVLCACRGCYLLFVPEGAGAGRYRAIPERYAYHPDFAVSDEQWDRLQIPVGLAFFFHNEAMERTVAFYPSPAGATESELPLDTWAEIIQANPEMTSPEPDVEALLLRRMPREAPDDGAAAADARMECYLIPIDVCYELVGRMRQKWRGFDGGEEVARELDEFFADLSERSKTVGAV